MTLGALVSAGGMGLLALSVARHDLPVFLLATSSRRRRLQPAVSQRAGGDQHRERRRISAAAYCRPLYLLAYLSMGAVALILGAVATASSLAVAVDLGAGIIAVLSLATIVLAGSTKSAA